MTAAVVLAAGPGTRLGRMGARMAKTMVPVAGRPFLEHLVGRLLGAGLHPVVVAVHHHEDAVVGHFAQHPLGDGLRFVHTDQLGTGADLLRCVDFLPGEEFVVWNGDTVVDIDLAAFLRYAGASDRAVIALSRRPDVPHQDAWFVGADGGVLVTLEAEPQPAPPPVRIVQSFTQGSSPPWPGAGSWLRTTMAAGTSSTSGPFLRWPAWTTAPSADGSRLRGGVTRVRRSRTSG